MALGGGISACLEDAAYRRLWSGMRKTALFLAAAAVLCGAYLAWPYWALYDLARAVEARDHGAIERQVDFVAVRRVFTDQIIRTYLRLTGRDAQLTPFRRDLIVAVTSTIADPIVAKLASPEALGDLLRTGWPASVLPDSTTGFDGLSVNALGNVWRLFLNSEYGLRDFYLSMPVAKPPEQQFRLQFRLNNWRWILSGVQLPMPVQEAIARELIKEHDSKPSRP
jgi:hypothetical protein